MENNPFSQINKTQDSFVSLRRSTRIDFVTTVLLTGKDATGTPFRELTQTAVVNVHGCKVRTSYRILVGMLLTVECPRAGTSGKGVCVKVWEPQPGIAGHEIAVQLIKPENIWGVTDPPPDWDIVTKSMVQGQGVSSAQPAQPVPPAVPLPAAAPRPTVTRPIAVPPALAMAPPPRPAAVPLVPVVAPAPAPVPHQAFMPVAPAIVSPARPAQVPYPTIEQRLADLEQRSMQLVDSAMENMRGQAEELTRNSLEEFRQQVDAVLRDAERQLLESLQQTHDRSAESLMSIRADLMEQLEERGNEMVQNTEETLRTRLRRQSVDPNQPAFPKPPDPDSDK